MGKYASIFNAKNVRDPEVMVHGFGRMNYSQLKKRVQEKLEDVVDWVDDDNFENAVYALDEKKSVLITHIRALKDVQDEIEELGNLTKK